MIIAGSRCYLKLLLFLCVFTLNASVLAQSSDSQESNWQFSLGLGLGTRTNPVMDNDNTLLIFIPKISYQGERFFIQNLDFGYTIYQDNDQQFNLLLTPSYDQVFFNEWDVNNFVDQSGFANAVKNGPTVELTDRVIDKRKLHDRRMAALAGLEYSQTVYGLDIQLQVLNEVTGYYDGSEARLSLSKGINVDKHDVKLTVGANWQSAKTLNYFYGLTQQEAQGHLPYIAGSGVTGLLRFDWNYQIDEHWSLHFFTSYRHLNRSISDSPLVTSDNVITAFAGGVYHF